MGNKFILETKKIWSKQQGITPTHKQVTTSLINSEIHSNLARKQERRKQQEKLLVTANLLACTLVHIGLHHAENSQHHWQRFMRTLVISYKSCFAVAMEMKITSRGTSMT